MRIVVIENSPGIHIIIAHQEAAERTVLCFRHNQFNASAYLIPVIYMNIVQDSFHQYFRIACSSSFGFFHEGDNTSIMTKSEILTESFCDEWMCTIFIFVKTLACKTIMRYILPGNSILCKLMITAVPEIIFSFPDILQISG
jgi:hypothetical protein